MKTKKHFCDKYIKKMNKEGMKFRKEMKNLLKMSRKKLKTATLKERPAIIQGIENTNNAFKEIKKNKHKYKKIYEDACTKGFFNPGCKGTVFENDPNLIDNFYVKTNADYLRKEGATSGCVISPFYL